MHQNTLTITLEMNTFRFKHSPWRSAPKLQAQNRTKKLNSRRVIINNEVERLRAQIDSGDKSAHTAVCHGFSISLSLLCVQPKTTVFLILILVKKSTTTTFPHRFFATRALDARAHTHRHRTARCQASLQKREIELHDIDKETEKLSSARHVVFLRESHYEQPAARAYHIAVGGRKGHGQHWPDGWRENNTKNGGFFGGFYSVFGWFKILLN